MTDIKTGKIATADLRWQHDPAEFEFTTTHEVDPTISVVGQEAAEEALQFGIECEAPGQNIYVRGVRGTGRLRMVRRIIKQLNMTTSEKRDRCYVHNFKRPDHPRLITLGAGRARAFRKRLNELADFVSEDLIKILEAEPYATQRTLIKENIEKEIRAVSEPLEKELAENNMAMVSLKQGPLNHPAIFPLIDGQPVPPDQFGEMIKQGKVTEEQKDEFEKLFPEFRKRMMAMGREVSQKYRSGSEQVDELNESAAREVLSNATNSIVDDFPGIGIHEFIDEIVDDVIDNRLVRSEENQADLKELYGVNIVLQNTDKTSRPVIEETTPSIINLLGTVEPNWGPGGASVSDYRGIRAGALLSADDGFLILNVADLVSEPGAWRSLMRTLRTGMLEIVPPEVGWMRPYVVVQPEPIEIHVRVILIGDVSTYYQLDRYDSDFRELFKVLADFDTQIDRDQAGAMNYAAVVSQMANDEDLLPFHRNAVSALVEHGARIASRAGKLTARFGRIADIARESAYLASKENQSTVEAIHIKDAIKRTKHRASLPSRKFQELVENKTILVATTGEVVGQINGLAVMSAGPLTYGFPARITATIGAGRAGLINIEGSAKMSGSIHTKGFHILGGLLRHLLPTSHPLAFSASLAFEQSYGGIDGDSASGAEMVCLLSALTDIPIKQSMAMTGAIDQHGHVEAIGGVNEKIEGFFDACEHFGLTGDQGVIIPASNAADLMLKEDVVNACREEKFHVFAVETIYQAIELMTGMSAGTFKDGDYPAGSLLNIALERAHEFWRRTLASPNNLTANDD